MESHYVLYQLFLNAIYYIWVWLPILVFILWRRKAKKANSIHHSNFGAVNKLAIGKNQKFLKCHFIPKGSKFTSAGFDSEFKVYFTKETFCFKASGFVFENDGVLLPKITDTWCESHNRKLNDGEINTFFEYIMNHDQDFIKKLQLCKP